MAGSDKIKVIRIHYEEGETFYDLYDREGNFRKRLSKPISIFNLRVKRFGFCIIDSVDITLELEKPISESEIKFTEF